jgi:hypothetical protein
LLPELRLKTAEDIKMADAMVLEFQQYLNGKYFDLGNGLEAKLKSFV